MTTEPATKGQQFLDLLRQQERGALLADAEEALIEVIEAVQRTGKAGKLTLTLKVQGHKDGIDEAALYIAAAITPYPPAPERKHTLWFGVDGRLSRRDPRQAELPTFTRVEPTHEAAGGDADEMEQAQ